jgi:hypothetical protein
MAAIGDHACEQWEHWEHWGLWEPMAAKENGVLLEFLIMNIGNHQISIIGPSAPSAPKFCRPMGSFNIFRGIVPSHDDLEDSPRMTRQTQRTKACRLP